MPSFLFQLLFNTVHRHCQNQVSYFNKLKLLNTVNGFINKFPFSMINEHCSQVLLTSCFLLPWLLNMCTVHRLYQYQVSYSHDYLTMSTGITTTKFPISINYRTLWTLHKHYLQVSFSNNYWTMSTMTVCMGITNTNFHISMIIEHSQQVLPTCFLFQWLLSHGHYDSVHDWTPSIGITNKFPISMTIEHCP